MKEHNGIPLTSCVNGTSICIDGHLAQSLESCSKSPGQKCKLGMNIVKRRSKLTVWLLCRWVYLHSPLKIAVSASRSVTYTRVLLRTSINSWSMWHETLGPWIHSWTTFCPKLICALCTDAKIIRFMECYASTHWTLWDSEKSATVLTTEAKAVGELLMTLTHWHLLPKIDMQISFLFLSPRRGWTCRLG